MDSLGAISSEKSPMRPWREGNWLGRRSRTSPWAIMSIVCANDGSMYVMRIAMSLVGGGCEGGIIWGWALRTAHTTRLWASSVANDVHYDETKTHRKRLTCCVLGSCENKYAEFPEGGTIGMYLQADN